jgi:hypothetical protein
MLTSSRDAALAVGGARWHDARSRPLLIQEIPMLKKFALPLVVLASLATGQAFGPAHAQTVAPAPTAKDAASYLIVTQVDMRKCASPMCGGYFVRAVNQALTRCADGSFRKECHVFTLNTDALGWTDDQRALFQEQFASGHALVKGRLASVAVIGPTKGDVVSVTEAWQGAALSKPKGTFFKVKSTGIVCITTPCPSIGATPLNLPMARTSNPDVDLASSGADEAAQLAGSEAIFNGGILAAGTLVSTRTTNQATGRVIKGSKLVTTEFYLPAKP